MSFLTSEWLLPQKEHMVRLDARAILKGGANGVRVVRLSEANTRGGSCLAIFEDLTKRGDEALSEVFVVVN